MGGKGGMGGEGGGNRYQNKSQHRKLTREKKNSPITHAGLNVKPKTF